ncbi:hypothetical protein GCM10007332_28260 [Epilithonimonas arachidiradicis]|uniref:Uncharacterized protein n=1 Tax=Epilithonimonas arachidiradicis TaxID=1617282 RepID=A0ABQ1XA90_9FLAO|nr:hypothetical protein GCM10007332_28260 [Epilithonimonas arachidiradicis]
MEIKASDIFLILVKFKDNIHYTTFFTAKVSKEIFEKIEFKSLQNVMINLLYQSFVSFFKAYSILKSFVTFAV